MSSVLELPADWGETALIGSPTDIKKGTRMNYGEWLQERFSKGFFDLTSLGMTLSKASEFPDEIKDAYLSEQFEWLKRNLKEPNMCMDDLIYCFTEILSAFHQKEKLNTVMIEKVINKFNDKTSSLYQDFLKTDDHIFFIKQISQNV